MVINNQKFEIERKFLVRYFPVEIEAESHFEISQGYISTIEDPLELRVRSVFDIKQNETSYFLTCKTGSGLIREEAEIQINSRLFELLWKETRSRIEKTRFNWKCEKTSFDLDIYKGLLNGLIVLEVEFENIDSANKYIPPEWIEKEITGIQKYTNFNLGLRKSNWVSQP